MRGDGFPWESIFVSITRFPLLDEGPPMRRLLALPIAALTAFSLAACGDSDTGDTPSDITSGEETTTSEVETSTAAEETSAETSAEASSFYASSDEFRAAMTSAGYECIEWLEAEDGTEDGECTLDGYGNYPVILEPDGEDPSGFVLMMFDGLPNAESVILGENWLFTCLDNLPTADCQEIADQVGGVRLPRSEFE